MNDVTAGSDASTRRYQEIIERVFLRRYTPGKREVPFARTELTEAASQLGYAIPKNLGDVVYSFRYRRSLPPAIADTAPTGREWAIFPAGKSVYCFRLVTVNVIEPRPGLRRTKIPDSTPGAITRYAMSDEQALLAGVRYNRLLDIFAGVTCYSLQSHLRTSIEVMNPISGSAEKSQVETDELYVGIDRHGAHYILPVQAKGGQDSLSIIQIWQDFHVAEQKFPGLLAMPVAAQFMRDGSIALFQFEKSEGEIAIAREGHYTLVPPSELTDEELAGYRRVAGAAMSEAGTLLGRRPG